MKLFKLIASFAIANFAISGFAHAEDFNVEVARVQLNLKCLLSQTDGGSIDCNINFGARGKMQIVMTAQEGDETKGYAGTDMATMDKSHYMLALTADDKKAMQGLAVVRMQQDENGSMNLSVVATPAGSLVASHINPLQIKLLEDQSMQIELGAVIYAPAQGENIVTSLSDRGLVDHILQQIKPAIEAAKRHL